MTPAAIRSYTAADVPEVAEFNRRLQSGGSAFRFPESAAPQWLPRRPGNPIFEEYFLALEGTAVRGGHILKHQPFHVMGETTSIGNLQLPLSEGIVDPRYRPLGPRLVQHAVQRQPLTYALGMGGLELPLPRLLKAMRWEMTLCPFVFLVCRPFRFLRQIAFLRRRFGTRLALDFLAFSGMGYVGLMAAQAIRKAAAPTAAVAGRVGRFNGWVDEIWDRARGQYTFAAVRDRLALDTLYPEHDARFHRLRIRQHGRDAGWAVVMSNRVTNHRQFGTILLGSLVDCLALPGEETAVVAAATSYLRETGADLIVTNQSHEDWVSAFRRQGYLDGPSNFAFGASPQLSERLKPFAENVRRAHLTRGDGDGPIHL